MNILIANDDGIGAVGIKRLAEALSEVADVYICAPEGERSCASHSIMMHQPLSVRNVPFENAKMALACTGTPVDCVRLGIKVYRDLGIDIDMVFSGINLGPNLGVDTIYSGTVGAAVEGSLVGIPSVAVSVTSHDATHFSYACDLAVGCARYAAGRLGTEYIININAPDLPREEVKGIRYAVPGKIDYVPWFILLDGEEGNKESVDLVYRYGGTPFIPEQAEDTDVILSGQGYATISPLRFDMGYEEKSDEIREWRIDRDVK